MCFSAEASFGVGAALLPAGVYCIIQAIKKRPSHLAFAAMPILFGVQQIGEGMVWRGLTSGNASRIQDASLFFLFFALAVWPFWVGFSAWLTERRPAARAILVAISVLGLAFGLLLFIPLMQHADKWLVTSTAYHSLRYDFDTLPAFQVVPRWAWQCLYVAIVLAPFLITQSRDLRVFGVLVVLSALLSHVAYWYAFVSVWCMFAAVLSIYLSILFYRLPNGRAHMSTMRMNLDMPILSRAPKPIKLRS